jgi:hypothetical protein
MYSRGEIPLELIESTILEPIEKKYFLNISAIVLVSVISILSSTIFVSAKQIYMLSQTCHDRTVPYPTVPYRMLTHSHSATSLYNLSQFKPISDQFTSIVYIVPASNLRTGVVWPRVYILCHFHILASKVSWFCLVFACHSTCDAIPKLSINMETYPHLVSSQIPHIYYFITYLYSKTIIVLWYFKQSKHSRQYICQWTMSQETNVLRRYWIKSCSCISVLNSVRCYELKYLYILVLHIRVYNN